MRHTDLNSLGVNPNEVEAALAGEHRQAVRRRLLALSRIVAGESIKQAAVAAKATRGSVEHWLKQVRQSGLQALLVDRRRRYAKRTIPPAQVKAMRRQIAVALTRPLKPQVRSRLVAIDTMISGKAIEEAAASAHVLPNAVRTWLRIVARDGVDATVARWQVDRRLRPGKLDVDPTTLHELAAHEIDPRVRKRIQALACVAGGMSTYDAEAKVRLGHWSITKRVGRFQEEGVAGFQDRKIGGRPPKLSSEQRDVLSKWIAAQPEIDEDSLCERVKAQFGVCYTASHMRRLMRAARTLPSDGKLNSG